LDARTAAAIFARSPFHAERRFREAKAQIPAKPDPNSRTEPGSGTTSTLHPTISLASLTNDEYATLTLLAAIVQIGPNGHQACHKALGAIRFLLAGF